jgi:hypothetical protein
VQNHNSRRVPKVVRLSHFSNFLVTARMVTVALDGRHARTVITHLGTTMLAICNNSRMALKSAFLGV